MDCRLTGDVDETADLRIPRESYKAVKLNVNTEMYWLISLSPRFRTGV